MKDADLPLVFPGILGIYLRICAYGAIGLFMSSITSYQVVAAMGTLAVLAALNYVGEVGQDYAFVRDITYWLSISGRAYQFIDGLICTEDVLYFLIVIVLFISLSILKLRAGRSTVDETIKATTDDQFWFENFRMGVWPDYYDGSQFPQSAEALEQFFRQITPNTGAYDDQLIATDVAALMDKIGGGILVTHSQGGGPGWHTAIKNDKVRAIVSYEPGSGFVFPEGETPEPLQTISPFGALGATSIPLADFEKLTRFPIIIYYGDYIPDEPSDNWAMDSWCVRLQMARMFADCVNRHGGDATVVHLPEQGIKGNSHFLFAEKNNVQLADLLSAWLKEKGLD